MSCHEIRQKYLDNDWDQAAIEEAAALAEHFRQCAPCRVAAAEYAQLRQLLRAPEPMPEPKTPFVLPRAALASDKAQAARPVARTSSVARSAALSGALTATLSAALAASLLAAIAGWTLYLHPPRSGQPTESLPVASGNPPSGNGAGGVPIPKAQLANAQLANAQLTHADIEHGVEVFNEVAETFQGRASWVALSDGSAELGLMPAAEAQDHKVLLFRLVMSEGDKEKSKTDLIIVPGQAATIDLPFEAGQVLHYNIATTSGAERRLSLWAEVRSPRGGGETLAALATQLQPLPGQTLSAGRMVTSSGGYNLEISFSEKDLAKGRP